MLQCPWLSLATRRGLLVVAFACSGSASALVATVASLESPPELTRDVAFWERVFTQVSPDHCLLHDRDQVELIYEVLDLRGHDKREQAAIVRSHLARLRSGLQALAGSGDADAELLRRLQAATPPRLHFPAYWRYAAANVRCQRGVALGASLARGQQLLPVVRRILDREGLPPDLAYLPHLESGFNPRARSRAGARGLWQLMPAAARTMGLRVSPFADARTDPIRATEAAARILKDYYGRTGSWPLAITAYNYGINGVARAVKLYGPDYLAVRRRHHTSVFGFAARNYYPSFIAVRNVARRMAAPVSAAAPDNGNGEDAASLFD